MTDSCLKTSSCDVTPLGTEIRVTARGRAAKGRRSDGSTCLVYEERKFHCYAYGRWFVVRFSFQVERWPCLNRCPLPCRGPGFRRESKQSLLFSFVFVAVAETG